MKTARWTSGNEVSKIIYGLHVVLVALGCFIWLLGAHTGSFCKSLGLIMMGRLMQLFLVLIIVELSNIYDGGILYNMEYYRSGYCVRDYIGEEDIIYIFFSLLGQGYHLLCFLLIMISNSSIMLYINACTWHLKNISTKKKKRKKKYSSPIKSTFPVRRVSVCSACVQSMFYLPCIFSFPGYSQHSR